MASEPFIKGLVFMGIRKFIRDHHGTQAWERLLERLTPGERSLIGETLTHMTWVPVAIFIKIYEGIKETWGKGGGEYYGEIFATIAEEHLNSFMRFLLHLASPHQVANAAPLVWRHFMAAGRLVRIGGSEHSIDLQIQDGEAFGEGLCYAIMGWGRKALELAGARHMSVDHRTCVYKGKDKCLFHVEWE